MMRRGSVLSIALVMLTAGCGDTAGPTPELRHARLADLTSPIQPFALQDTAGAAFSLDDLEGRWTVVFSGFTSCPDICPSTLAVLRSAQQGLDLPANFQTVFVSVDPERDTPERIARYLAWFDQDWIGVTGEREELARLMESLQMAYVRVPLGNGEYTVDHATAVALIAPDTRLVGWWTAPITAGNLREDLARLAGLEETEPD